MPSAVLANYKIPKRNAKMVSSSCVDQGLNHCALAGAVVVEDQIVVVEIKRCAADNRKCRSHEHSVSVHSARISEINATERGFTRMATLIQLVLQIAPRSSIISSVRPPSRHLRRTGRNTGSASGVELTNWYLYNAISTATEWTNLINGTQFSTTGSNTVGFTSTPWFGANANLATAAFQGKIAALYIFNVKLSATERTTMKSYIAERFALTLA
jgi:hypothetical protein